MPQKGRSYGSAVPAGRDRPPPREAAKAWLRERNYGFKNLRSQAEDLSQAPLGNGSAARRHPGPRHPSCG